MAFDQFPQPESNDSSSVESALEALRNSHDPSSAEEAHDRFLWAMGNNHTGTFYPVILAVLPQIEQILRDGGTWPSRAVIESFIDLGGSFVPEEGHEEYLGASVQETLRAFIQSMRPRVALLAQGGGALATSASDLLDLIDDQAA